MLNKVIVAFLVELMRLVAGKLHDLVLVHHLLVAKDALAALTKTASRRSFNRDHLSFAYARKPREDFGPLQALHRRDHVSAELTKP